MLYAFAIYPYFIDVNFYEDLVQLILVKVYSKRKKKEIFWKLIYIMKYRIISIE